MSDTSQSRRRWVLWIVGIGFLPASIIAFYLIENYRGERAWAAAQTEMQAAGLSLNLEEYLAAPLDVSDDENMAAAVPYRRPVSEVEFYSSSPSFLPRLGLQINQAPDLRVVTGGFATHSVFSVTDPAEKPAQSVLRALAAYPEVGELDSALARPHASFTVPWHSGMYPVQGQLWYAAGHGEVLAMRACARIALGQGADALEDLRLLIKLAKVTSTPTGMGLVYSAFARPADIAWYGLASNIWTADQRREIDVLFAGVEPAAMTLRAVAGQNAHFHGTMERYISKRSMACDDFEKVRQWNSRRTSSLPVNPTLLERLVAASPNFVPGGWFRHDQAAVATETVQLVRELKACAELPGHFKPTRLTSEAAGTAAKATRMLVLPDDSTLIWRPVIDNQRRLAANIAMLRTAIAVVDHREATGTLPGKLAELKVYPDPITGQALRYEKVDATRFKLWSVGLDAVDDCGIEEAAGKTGDWVWKSWVPEGKR